MKWLRLDAEIAQVMLATGCTRGEAEKEVSRRVYAMPRIAPLDQPEPIARPNEQLAKAIRRQQRRLKRLRTLREMVARLDERRRKM